MLSYRSLNHYSHAKIRLRIWHKWLCVLSLLLVQSCTTPVGTTHVFKVSNDQLVSPLQSANMSASNEALIFQSDKSNQVEGNDIFSVYLTDSYLRYLPDLGGINEVIIVAEFTEVVTGDKKKDTVTKILGPYTNIADATKAPFLNKLLYGPKRMESDVLSMKLQVFEYDRGENDDNAAMLDFISSSGEALGLANPITLAELAITKEIAKALIQANDNDLVFAIDIDFVAGNSNLSWSANDNTHIVPLAAGDLVFIKQEACRIGTCFDYFSHGGTNTPGFFADAIMALPTAVVRSVTDVPDGNGLSDVNSQKIKSSASYLQNESEATMYTDKTWLRMAVVKGGNASKWEQRKQWYEVEADVDRLVRNQATLSASKVTELGDKLKALQLAQQASSQTPVFRVKNTLNNQLYWYLDDNNQSFTACIRLPDNGVFVSASIRDFGVNFLPSSVDSQCMTFTANKAVDDGTPLLLDFRYKIADTEFGSHLRVSAITTPKLVDVQVSCVVNKGNTEGILTGKVTHPEVVAMLKFGEQEIKVDANTGNFSMAFKGQTPTGILVFAMPMFDKPNISLALPSSLTCQTKP